MYVPQLRRTAAVVPAVALVLSGIASANTAHAAAAETSVTVVLAAPSPSRLAALAADVTQPVADRQSRLAALLPSAAQRADAIHTLIAEGLHVTSQTAWSVTASGPINALAPSMRIASPAVSAVFPTDTGPVAVHPGAAKTLTGADFRNAYASPVATAAGKTPSTGSDRNGALTIATVQFAKWHSSDLTGYSKKAHLTLGAHQFTPITVDGGPKNYDGQDEVDLDQEALLSTAPTADQRAYFAPNTDAGQIAAYSQVLDDVTGNKYAIDGGDSHIAALSSSWGDCEQDVGTKLENSLEPVLESLVAAGVTVFNSSGDNGIYDCGQVVNGDSVVDSTTEQADFPGSSPYVVSVGASNLKPVGASAANNGSDWAEKAWTCSSPATCEEPDPVGTGGTGGGVSEFFGEPSWQNKDIGNSTYTSAGRRLVPDISADGDPQTGFDVYTSACGETPCSEAYGGTSLATPESAALLTNLLASYGREFGIGDIHAGLYAAFAATRNDTVSQQAFRDITVGSNGAAANKGKDPSTLATTGYDTVGGLGGVIWPNVAPYLLSLSEGPKVSGSLALNTLHSATRAKVVTASWHLGEHAKGTGPQSVTIVVDKVGSSKPVLTHTSTKSGKTTFTASGGHTYVMTVTGKDVAGVTATSTTSSLPVPIDDKGFDFHGSWSRVKSASDYADSRAVSSSASAKATVSATGRKFAVKLQTGSSLGELAVYLGSKKLKTLDLYSASTHHVDLLIYGSSHASAATHTFTFRPTGKKNKKSKGTAVDLDGLRVVS